MLTHNDLQIKHVSVSLGRLPSCFENFKVVQLSDLHFYENTDEAYYTRVVNEANALKPDLLVVTGDIIHYGNRYIDLAKRFLESLEAKYCKLAILGNHDYYDFSESLSIRAMLEAAGFTVLVNENITIQHLDNPQERLTIAGVDDLWKGVPDLQKTLKGLEDINHPVVLLAHNPLLFDPASEYLPVNVALQLSGHTHAGHVYIPFLEPVHHYVFNAKYRYGLFKKNNSQLYVTSGVGSAAFYIKQFGLKIALPRFRFNTLPEIAVIRLQSV